MVRDLRNKKKNEMSTIIIIKTYPLDNFRIEY